MFIRCSRHLLHFINLFSLFIGVSDRQEEHGNTQVLKERKKMEEDLKGYREWLKKACEFRLTLLTFDL